MGFLCLMVFVGVFAVALLLLIPAAIINVVQDVKKRTKEREERELRKLMLKKFRRKRRFRFRVW